MSKASTKGQNTPEVCSCFKLLSSVWRKKSGYYFRYYNLYIDFIRKGIKFMQESIKSVSIQKGAKESMVLHKYHLSATIHKEVQIQQ